MDKLTREQKIDIIIDIMKELGIIDTSRPICSPAPSEGANWSRQAHKVRTASKQKAARDDLNAMSCSPAPSEGERILHGFGTDNSSTDTGENLHTREPPSFGK